MEQNEIITALHAQLKEAAQSIFAKLEIKPGKYAAAEVEKEMKFAEAYRIYNTTNFARLMDSYTQAREAFQAVDDEEHRKAAERLQTIKNRRYAAVDTIKLGDEYNHKRYNFNEWSGKYNAYTDARDKAEPLAECVNISCGTFTASMPAALVFAKLAEWEKEFKIKTSDKAVFVKEEEGEAIGSCVVEFPKEAKYIVEYAGTDPVRPVMMGVFLDVKNSCIVASDTRVISEYPVTVSEIEGEPLSLIIDPKIIKAVAGQRCEVKQMKDAEKNISIKTEKGEIYTCENIKGRFPDYRRVYPKVNRSGLVELTKDGAAALANFAKSTAKQTKDTRAGSTCIKIEIPACSATGTATYYDMGYHREKTINFTVKGSPSIDIVFGIHAFHLAMVTKNWAGCFWFTDPSRPIVFDNIKSSCTVIMPMQLLVTTDIKPGYCTGVVEALKRHSHDIAEAETTQHQQTEEKRINEESTTITRAEKEECAIRYCKIKGVMADIVTDNDEIIAVTPNGCKARYVGKFRRSGEIVIFDCEKNFISIPKLEETPTEQPTETPQEPPQDTGTDRRDETPPKTEETAGNVSAAPPEHPETIHIISGPPGLESHETINHQPLIKENHDRNNNLAPPHLHYRCLRLSRFPGGIGYSLRNLRVWHPYIVAACQVDRQTSRGSPKGKGEGNRRMGAEMEKETLHTQIT